MTTDPFTEAARAEADDRFLINPDHPGQTTEEWIAIFEQAAEWARAYLAAQEPSDAEVEAVANVLAESEDTGSVETARAALSAARATRRDKEQS